jgi:predicted AlkP superfamily phosphohydrolase/phosphomutase
VSARVLVVGLDACEVTLVERWAREGLLPHFATLQAASRAVELDGPMRTLPGGIWPEIHTGMNSATSGHFYVPNQLRSGEARLRATRVDEVDAERYYWTLASRHGRRVAVIDPVQAAPAPRLNGAQLFEWGLHDRWLGVQSDPPELLRSLRSRHGDHPVTSCDCHGETIAGYRKLRDGLLQGLAAKADFAPELLANESWDLYFCTISESHCAGHQFWHFIDPRHPWHDPSAPPDLREALLRIYQGIDEAVGRLVAAAGPDAEVLTVFSHGMDLYFDGPQLLPEFLVRLGLASGGNSAAGSRLRAWKTRITHLPRPVKKVIKRLAQSAIGGRAAAAAGCLVDPFESAQTRAGFVTNNRCGGIRLNLRGREPLGCIEPGDEADQVLAHVARELRALVNPANGKPIVADVFTARERFGACHHPDLPDLLCEFRTDAGMIEDCESPAVGRIHAPIYHPHSPRSGDHTPHSRVWMSGPLIDARHVADGGHVTDIAATVLAMLDVPVPAWIDGTALCHARTPRQDEGREQATEVSVR